MKQRGRYCICQNILLTTHKQLLKMRGVRVLIATCLCMLAPAATLAQINVERMINIGRNALYYEDYALSIQYFNMVISSRPNLYSPFFYRGLAKFYLEDYMGAESDCTRAIDLNPYFSNSYHLRGLARINQERFADAAADYKEATRLEPRDKAMWQNLALCYLEIDSLDQADSTLLQFIHKWPDLATGYCMRAQMMLAKGDTVMADTLVCEALRHDKYDLSALSMRSGLQMHSQDYAGAETTLNEALRLQPKHTGNLINRGICRFNQDNYRGAIADYDLAIDIDSTNFVGRYNRGLLLASVGEDNKAIKDFDYILSIDPNDIMTLFNRARLLDQTGDYRAAIRDYTRVIEEFPKFLYGYQLRAEARRKIGDIRGANRDEEHILRENVAHHYGYSTPTSRMKNRTRKKSQIDPNDYSKLIVEETEETHYEDEYRGKIQNHSADIKLMPVIMVASNDNTYDSEHISRYYLGVYGVDGEALNDFNNGIDFCLQADDQRLSNTGNADAQALNGIYAQAEFAFDRVASKAPQFAEAFYNRAFCRAMQGKFDDAQSDLRHAITLKPTFARAMFNLGIITYQLNNQQEAMQLLSKAGELGIYNAYSVIKQIKNK